MGPSKDLNHLDEYDKEAGSASAPWAHCHVFALETACDSESLGFSEIQSDLE